MVNIRLAKSIRKVVKSNCVDEKIVIVILWMKLLKLWYTDTADTDSSDLKILKILNYFEIYFCLSKIPFVNIVLQIIHND